MVLNLAKGEDVCAGVKRLAESASVPVSCL